MKKRHIQDVAKISGVDEEMVRLLPDIRSRCNIMNPWRRSLPGIFRGLRLHSGQELLDIPCGEGGVSVPLARKYRVKVTGHDILPEYVERANRFACYHRVGDLCRFTVRDIHEIVNLKKKFDILLWIAPPHIWGKSKPTIRALRSCVKIGGVIVIGDAYLYSKSNGYDEYETLEETTEGYTSFGDHLHRLYDYKGSLWQRDYEMERRLIQSAIHRIEDEADKRILRRHLKKQNENEKSDKKYLGTAIWVIERR
jgi:SAM-dependent methyltransferase